MKRIITYITLIIIFTTLGFLGLFNQPKEVPSKDILNNTYYLFNTNTGEYESMMITKDVIVSNTIRDNRHPCIKHERQNILFLQRQRKHVYKRIQLIL